MGLSDIALYHRITGPSGGPRKRRIVLVVQCKGAEHETKGSVWKRETEQLGDYIFTKVGARKGVDGAIAIGRCVKLIKYNYRGARAARSMDGAILYWEGLLGDSGYPK